LYNWYTVNTGKLAPTGWHVPTDAEWTALGNYLTANGYNYDGSTSGDYYAKSLAATTSWTIDPYTEAGAIGHNLSKNNSTGFSALPGGYRDYGFVLTGDYCHWWSATENDTTNALDRIMVFDSNSLDQSYDDKELGSSVRCIRDN